MKVTKEMLHEDLRPYYGPLNAVTAVGRFKPIIKLMNLLTKLRQQGKDIDSLDCAEHFVPSGDGEWKIRTRVYRPKNVSGKLPVMLYIHGGGYIAGNPEQSGLIIEKFIQTRPCVVVSPDYRKAYTQPFPAGFNDCYETLLWARANADQLGIDAEKVIVAGHSAGGGLTAAVTLKARDTQDVDIAFQMPIYPMIDDRQPSDPDRYIKTPVWDTGMNKMGWQAYLADLLKQGSDIPAYAAPARNTDYKKLPPTVTFVGSLEPFYQETLDYVEALKKENVDVAFKVYDGCFHGFEFLSPKAKISQAAQDFTFSQFSSFYDRYVG